MTGTLRPLAAGLALAVFATVTSAAQKPAAPAERPKTGLIDFGFTERSSHSAIDAMGSRLGWTREFIRKHDPTGDYDLAKEKFVGWVPEDYDGVRPFGLLVWVNPVDTPWIDPAWIPVLGKRRLIAVEALGAGNDRFVWARIGLALDAVHNLSKRYRIDPSRIFVGGFSGGGRVASTLGLHWPDVFRGAYAMGGCNWFERLEGGGGAAWEATIPRPSAERLRLARTRSRIVLMAGAGDFNRDHSRACADHARKVLGFTKLLWQEVPDLAHAPTPAEWFEKGLAHLDS